MWHWIRRSGDWLMSNALAAARGRPGRQSLYVRYEAAGQTFYELPIPWSADAVVVEAILRLPPSARLKSDFSIRLPGRPPVLPETLKRDPIDPMQYRLTFRIATPPTNTRAELLWKNHWLEELSIPILQSDQFQEQLQLHTPTVSVRLGEQSIAARTFVAAQCKGISFVGLLRAAGGLVPLGDIGCRVVFRCERTAEEQVVPITLSSSQLASKEALIVAVAPKAFRRVGFYTVSCVAGNRELARVRVEAISAARFVQSLRISDTRFVVIGNDGVVRVVRQAPLHHGPDALRFGPCFLVASREPGIAARLMLQAVPQNIGLPRAEPLQETILITDGPAIFAPGVFEVALGLTSFELRYKTLTLGTLPVRVVPTAAFTSEGGFKPPPDFVWTPSADEDLSERLQKLMQEKQR